MKKAEPVVMKTLKVSPSLLQDIENAPGYSDFSSFAREALEHYIKARSTEAQNGIHSVGQRGRADDRKGKGKDKGGDANAAS